MWQNLSDIASSGGPGISPQILLTVSEYLVNGLYMLLSHSDPPSEMSSLGTLPTRQHLQSLNRHVAFLWQTDSFHECLDLPPKELLYLTSSCRPRSARNSRGAPWCRAVECSSSACGRPRHCARNGFAVAVSWT